MTIGYYSSCMFYLFNDISHYHVKIVSTVLLNGKSSHSFIREFSKLTFSHTPQLKVHNFRNKKDRNTWFSLLKRSYFHVTGRKFK